ncbi:MAG: hypothetical protein NZV14_11135 [Bryobacteraceae bacterium]|nr:hypothetical protein [Bryobacteraceae bacterium]MDW8378706.1 hypothetical protein [Bryobacterales bacterium]
MTKREIRSEEPPPLGGDWFTLYALVVLYLLVLIALFAWFTQANTPEATP